ncbi:hypothetical protein MY4038_003032 [Beauveria bassiana]
MSAVDAALVLANRVKKLGICGNVPALLVYERPSSVWHVTHHCPQGMAFPDLNAMLELHEGIPFELRARPKI